MPTACGWSECKKRARPRGRFCSEQHARWARRQRDPQAEFRRGHNPAGQAALKRSGLKKAAAFLARESPNAAGRRIQELMRARGLESVNAMARISGMPAATVVVVIREPDHTLNAATARRLAEWDGEWDAERYLTAAGSAARNHERHMRERVRPHMVLRFCREYVAANPDDVDARVITEKLAAALKQGGGQGSGLLTVMQALGSENDGMGDYVRGRFAAQALAKRPDTALWRLSLVVGATYARASRGQLPRLVNLLREPDRQARRRGRPVAATPIPAEFRSRWGLVVLSALILQLLDNDWTMAQVATYFHWPVEHRHSRMVSALAAVGSRLDRPPRRRLHNWRHHWARAKREAAICLRKILPEEKAASA